MTHRFSNTKAQREAIHAAEQMYRAVERIKAMVRPIVREVLAENRY